MVFDDNPVNIGLNDSVYSLVCGFRHSCEFQRDSCEGTVVVFPALISMSLRVLCLLILCTDRFVGDSDRPSNFEGFM